MDLALPQEMVSGVEAFKVRSARPRVRLVCHWQPAADAAPAA